MGLQDEEVIWQRFFSLLDKIDRVFLQVREQFPQQAHCVVGCTDCCHAAFSLTFVEGLWLGKSLQEARGHEVFAGIHERAARYPVEMARQMGAPSGDPAGYSEQLARVRIRCPLLGEDGRCIAYQARPVTCRIYGVPTELAGTGHVCGFSGFVAGSVYPTVKLDQINLYLLEISRELAAIRGLPEAAGLEKKYLFEIVADL